jgi:hypothetical protein
VNNGNVQQKLHYLIGVGRRPFTSVCSVNVANGAKTFHVDVVQSVVGLSISKSYVFTAKYIASGPRRQVAAITSSGPYTGEDWTLTTDSLLGKHLSI